MLKFPSRILLATGNPHKATEMRAILAKLVPSGVVLCDLRDINAPSPPDDVERHRTFAANARAKALWCRDEYDMACIADDSGLCVEALGGAPGVLSARWAGPTDADRNRRLLEELRRVGADSAEQRVARFYCAAAFVPETGPALVASGALHGRIAERLSGEGGFGYDPLFHCLGFRATLAEVSEAVKNAMSHRAVALMHLTAQFQPNVP